MSRFISSLVRCTTLRIESARLIAMAIISLFTHTAMAQSHQNLAAVIAGGNDALSESVYGLHTTAYGNSEGFQIAGDGSANVLKFKAGDFTSINFNDDALNQVNTVVIRFNEETLVDGTFDGSLLSSLENLSAVVLLCSVDVSASRASTIALNNLPSGAASYYVISIPE